MWTSTFATGIALALTLLVQPSLQQAPAACNGSPALCDRKYSNITFIGTHNSAFDGLSPSDNQNVPIEEQLDAGIRFLQAQVHIEGDGAGELRMCHASCILRDAGPLEDYLGRIKVWLDAHPREVVTLLIVNGDGAEAARYAGAFDVSGLQQYAYIPPTNPLPMGDWPTLGEMIDRGTRLVAMLDGKADVNVAPFILDEFTYFFETPFAITDPEEFKQCRIDRPGGTDGKDRMMMMNHFLGVDIFGIRIPDRLAASRTNAATGPSSIGEQADICLSEHARWPNCVLVDWFDRGDVFAAQNKMNGL